MKSKKVLFLAPYPIGNGPSQRFRLEVYLPYLNENNIEFFYHTFYSKSAYSKLYDKGKFFPKFLHVLSGFFRRFYLLLHLHKFDYIFIQREVTPVGPPVLEWIMAKVFRKKIIYDFDDAIWLPNFSNENAMFQRLKSYWKVKHIIKWSYKVVVGNPYLHDYARQYSEAVITIPTVVDMIKKHNKTLHKNDTHQTKTIGWTGSVTTNKYIESLAPVFTRLNEKFDYKIQLISNKRPNINLPNVIFEKWNLQDEIEQLLKIDIGIMPVPAADKFAKGKCGFKAIQYMSLGITTVVTPVGVNADIVQHGINGYHALSENDWYDVLSKLLAADLTDSNMVGAAQNKIEQSYSVTSQKEKFLSLFS